MNDIMDSLIAKKIHEFITLRWLILLISVPSS